MPQSPLQEPLTTPKSYHIYAADDTAAAPRKCEPLAAGWVTTLLRYSLIREPPSGHGTQQQERKEEKSPPDHFRHLVKAAGEEK